MGVLDEPFEETELLLEDCLLVECEVAVLEDEGGNAGQWASLADVSDWRV